jgi:hypothetical protein
MEGSSPHRAVARHLQHAMAVESASRPLVDFDVLNDNLIK